MNKYTFFLAVIIITCISFCSCGIKTILLEDKIAEVPRDSKNYRNKSKFDISILNMLDTNAIYYEINSSRNLYGIYKFYPNGNLNLFFSNGYSTPSKEFFNPYFRGYRGVYYKENGSIKGDLFAEVDQKGNIGKLKETYIFKGDTLTVKTKNREISSTSIYIKRKLPPEYFMYNANW